MELKGLMHRSIYIQFVSIGLIVSMRRLNNKKVPNSDDVIIKNTTLEVFKNIIFKQ